MKPDESHKNQNATAKGTGVRKDATQADMEVPVNMNGVKGNYYYIVTEEGATKPTNAQILASGKKGTLTGSTNVQKLAFTVSGLANEKAKSLHFLVENEYGQLGYDEIGIPAFEPPYFLVNHTGAI